MKRANELLNLGSALPLDFLPGEMMDLVLLFSCIGLSVTCNQKHREKAVNCDVEKLSFGPY